MTPMQQQYQEIKSRHRDCILFFRLGDFYEMFYEDAQDASRLLDLVLTGRGKAEVGRVPMCGIPFHAADNYIGRLVKAGRKVAICEQVEDPAKAKGLVKRDVVRIITAGTYLDEAADARYIASVCFDGKQYGLAFTDTATGVIHANQLPLSRAVEALAKLPLNECIFPEGTDLEIFQHPLLRLKSVAMTPFRAWSFGQDRAYQTLCDHFEIKSLRGFGIEDVPLTHGASGALVEYLKEMNKTRLAHLDRVALYDDGEYVFIAPAAHHGLEMASLLEVLDQTLTPMGKRTLRFWLYHPLKDPMAICARQDAVELLKGMPDTMAVLGSRLLKNIPDVEKSLSRISCACASPKDLLALRQALVRGPELGLALAALSTENPLFVVQDLPELREKLERAIDPEMPLAKNEGRVIRAGFHAELDGLKNLQEGGRAWLASYQADEIRRTGIHSLKVGFNRVFGYYIEVTNVHLKSVPADYQRKQTLANGERFITPELKEFELSVLSAEEKVLRIEAEIIRELERAVLSASALVHRFCREIAGVDVLYSLSLLALRPGYVRPKMSAGDELVIVEGRHPVVEAILPRDFIPNDTQMDCVQAHLMILTGPNMAGKSTYIRQNAILVVMAQMGSFIPAASAVIGVVDKIFTRIGAHDEISKGQSTFMVEMTEAADIVNNMTPKSLVILDEIGRGTSTYDGLAIAWSLAEFLAERRVRTLFATHFHELTLLADQYRGVKNFNVAVREWEEKIIFLHKIIPGGTDDSYGIYVAKLAGMPAVVIQRAKKILAELEKDGNLRERLKDGKKSSGEGDLFARAMDTTAQEILAELQALDVNALTPIQALGKLNELKNLVG
ncbi:MAG: DNA mismatch repair protein MutS [Candidatus Omnitrophota bacterium]